MRCSWFEKHSSSKSIQTPPNSTNVSCAVHLLRGFHQLFELDDENKTSDTNLACAVHFLEGLHQRLCLELRGHDVETAGESDKSRSTVVGKVDEDPVVCLALNHPPSPLFLDCVLIPREYGYKGVGRDVAPDIVLRDAVVDVFTIGLVVQLALVRVEDASRGIVVDHGDDARVWDAVAMDNLQSAGCGV